MRGRRAFVFGLGSAGLTACTCDDDRTRQTRAPLPPFLRRVDAHLHVSRGGVSRAVDIMQREGIAWGVNLSGGAPGHGLREQIEQAKSTGARLITFTSPHWPECATVGFAARLTDGLHRAVEMGARGLKIQKALGLTVVGPDGKLLQVNAPELDPLFEAAGRLQVPVWIHTGDPLAFWRQADAANERLAELTAHPDWSLYQRQVPSFDELYAQLEQRIERHRDTQFVSVHFGNCAEQPQRVAASLRRHPNLWIDTAARVPELGRHSPEQLRNFFAEFEDRILFGSDLGVGPDPKPLFLGSSGTSPATESERRLFFDATRRYFESSDQEFDHPTPIQGTWKISGLGLPHTTLEKLYVTNAARVLGITG